MLGLTSGSYEAYCLDQAVWYFGSVLQNELEKAGQDKQKGQAKVESARTRVLNKYLKKEGEKGQFADPASFFNK